MSYTGSGPIRATICWTDPPGTSPPSAVDPTTRVLVNDLDLRIVDPDGIVHEPWLLNLADPAAPATTGNNAVDNVEMVVVDEPLPGEYVIRISHAVPLTNGIQSFALILSGATSSSPIDGACCALGSCTGTTTEGVCVAQGDTWYGGVDCGGFVCPPGGACCTGCPPTHACALTDSFECAASGGVWSPNLSCAEVTCLTPGDDCASDMIVANDGSYPIDNRCATTDGPTPVVCDTEEQLFRNDLWFGYQATCTGTVTASMCGDSDL